MARPPRVAAAIVLAALAWLPARAGAISRPRFEPTDLEWEDTGIAEVDLQFGPVRGQGPWRIVVPDFERVVWSVRPSLDLSLTGLVGSLSGGDRYGLLVGVSPKVRIFK